MLPVCGGESGGFAVVRGTRLPTLPTVEEWEQACGLKRRGAERVGPCPRCGGDDRFHVRPGCNGGPPLVGCRGCLDGRPGAERQAAFGAILQTVFPDRNRRRPGSVVRFPAPRKPATRSTPDRDTAPLALELWAAGSPAESSPAHEYLAGRKVCPPPPAVPSALPESVRWVPRQACGKVYGLPKAAAGLVLFGLRPVRGGDVHAVQSEALAADGKRTNPRWRKTYGALAGLAFEAAAGNPGRPVVLCEGPVTALASRWLRPDCRVLAGCGGRLPELADRLDPRIPLELEVDGDPAGRRSTEKLADRLRRTGRRVKRHLHDAGDAADTLAARAAAGEQPWKKATRAEAVRATGQPPAETVARPAPAAEPGRPSPTPAKPSKPETRSDGCRTIRMSGPGLVIHREPLIRMEHDLLHEFLLTQLSVGQPPEYRPPDPAARLRATTRTWPDGLPGQRVIDEVEVLPPGPGPPAAVTFGTQPREQKVPR